MFQGHVTFILQDELEVAPPFLDDIPILGRKTRYMREDGTCETIPENTGIRRFVWEHLQDVNRIFHRMKHAGATFSGHKLWIGMREVNIVSHTCNFEGRVPDQARVSKITNWPPCESVTEVRGFLGTCGVVRIFIEAFAEIARPLVFLTRKNVTFIWEEPQQSSMDLLKKQVTKAPALMPLDYSSQRLIIVAVDSSNIAVGWIVYQLDKEGRRCPSRYGSIAWSDRESRYSQAKIELYGVYRALRALRIYLIGLPTFNLEVDTKYIQGMINNPDIQPNNAMNRWIAAILLFTFKLVHVPGKEHGGPDGLSRRKAAGGDVEEREDGWVDEVLGLGIWVNSWMEGSRCEDGFVEEDTMGTAHTPTFLVFSLSGTQDDLQIEIPRSKDDVRMDEQLPLIFTFLSTARKPPGLDEKTTRQFIQRSLRFFMKDGKLWRKDASGMHRLVILDLTKRLSLISQAHNQLGHKQAFSTRRHLSDRFWWPGLDRNVTWFCKTCHECQLCSTQQVFILPTVATPAPLFHRAHLDTMHMPRHSGLQYIIQARCSLMSYAEFKMLSQENGQAIGKFIFQEILCRWGVIAEIITDNGTPIVAALDWLSKKYHISHI